MELTNREIAVTAWLVGGFLFVLTWRDMRRSVWGIVKVAAGPRLAIPAILYASYVWAVVAVAHLVGIWEFSLLKDTLVWFVVGGLVLFGKFLQTRSPRFLRRTILATIAVPEILGFTLGLVSFPLIVELVMLPVIALVATVGAYAATNAEYSQVRHLMDRALAVAGFLLLGLTFAQLAATWAAVDWHHVALTFYLPIWLTAAALPFVYLLGRYSEWEVARIRRTR